MNKLILAAAVAAVSITSSAVLAGGKINRCILG